MSKQIRNRVKRLGRKVEVFLSKEPDFSILGDGLYVLFFTMSLMYGVLIWGACEKIKRDTNIQVTDSKLPEDRYELKEMVKNHPIEQMVPYISSRNKKTASYLVAIAKKESDWGRHAPQKDGRDCYNYWGYRGTYNQTDSGYSCFDSPRQAVSVVGKRIQELAMQDVDTPREMSVWKCGRSCDMHSEESVEKWIQDVDFYYKKAYN